MWNSRLIMTREQIRAYDRIAMESFGMPGVLLMENAGAGAAAFLLKHDDLQQRAAVICGPGNNGGDGFVVARHLLNAGRDVTVYLAAPQAKISGDARLNFEILRKMQAEIIDISTPETLSGDWLNLSRFDLIVDALLGTGVSREVEGHLADIIDRMNGEGDFRPVVSLDIPSGLDADSGRPWGSAVRARATVTFGHLKRGLVLYPGVTFAGSVNLVPIGVPGCVSEQAGFDGQMISKEMLLPWLPHRKSDGHKGTFGHLLVVGGFSGKTGAAAMVGQAALRIGCGLVTTATSVQARPSLEAKCLEIMVDHIIDEAEPFPGENVTDRIARLLENKKAVVLGPGLGTQPNVAHAALQLLNSLSVPAVVDADGIHILAADPIGAAGIKAPLILTPHPGEMAVFVKKSVQEVQADRVGISREAAQRHQAVMVLKGAHTVVASPDGRVFVNPTGNAGMSTAGMGDVLAGMIGGLLAQGVQPLEAALLGVYLHGAAGDRMARIQGEAGLIASDVIAEIPHLWMEWSVEKRGRVPAFNRG